MWGITWCPTLFLFYEKTVFVAILSVDYLLCLGYQIRGSVCYEDTRRRTAILYLPLRDSISFHKEQARFNGYHLSDIFRFSNHEYDYME